MKHLSAALTALLVATPALAHGGHVEAVAGHSHWLALIALGMAVIVGVAAFALRRRSSPSTRKA